jgi:hypothetical protein
MTEQSRAWIFVVVGMLLYGLEYFRGDRNTRAFGSIIITNHPGKIVRLFRSDGGPLSLLPVVVELWAVAQIALGIGLATSLISMGSFQQAGYLVYVEGGLPVVLALILTIAVTQVRARRRS